MTRTGTALGALLPWLLTVTVGTAQQLAKEPGPTVAPAVRTLLDEAAARFNKGDPGGALDVTEQALALARRTGDRGGEAQSVRVRAVSLLQLGRAAESGEGWREAQALWQALGEGPGQVEAIGFQAVIGFLAKAPDALDRLRQSIALARAETRSPRTAASRLFDVALHLKAHKLLIQARETVEAVVEIQRRVGVVPEQLAATLGTLGELYAAVGQTGLARESLERALELRLKLSPDSDQVVGNLHNLAVVASATDLKAARDYLERALAIQTAKRPGSLAEALALQSVGTIALRQGDLAAAGDTYRRAADIMARVSPASADYAAVLADLGLVARDAGEFQEARALTERSLAIRQKIAPDSVLVAVDLDRLGILFREMGDLAAAEARHRAALEILQRQAPGSVRLASTLNSIGSLAYVRGELGTARSLYEQARSLYELHGSEPDVAGMLQNLGNVARRQGDLHAARAFYQRSIDLTAKLAPGGPDFAARLINLGRLALDESDLAGARALFTQALGILERENPRTPVVAAALDNLGAVAREAREFAAAAEFAARALAIRTELAPQSLDVAGSLASLGRIAFDAGRLDEAETYFRQALERQEAAGGDTPTVAGVVFELGRVASRRGEWSRAIALLERAWRIVRNQALGVSGDEAQQAFASATVEVVRELVRARVAAGDAEGGFSTLEEGRAQSLIRLMAERGLARRLAPTHLWQAYEVAQATSDRLGRALETAADPDATALRAYTESRLEAERRWADVRESLRGAAPGLTAAVSSKRELPADTVLAAFTVGEDETTLFLVRRDAPVASFVVPATRVQLEGLVRDFRAPLARDGAARGLTLVASSAEHTNAARRLFQTLFPAPARQQMLRADRILLSPDAVLWDVPFAALVINDRGTPRYLGLEKPLIYAQSLAAFSASLSSASETRTPFSADALVVGNPTYAVPSGDVDPAPITTGPGSAGELALLSRDGETPAPLPNAEVEARRVAEVYHASASTGLVPTERWVRERVSTAGVIHLATHGYFNPRRAMGSGVRLAAPGSAAVTGETDNDGALQAWEVFSQLRLRAELVVLSACQTGEGSKVPGEGLIGLTRAFQVAGAASVVATQWSVADRSTATAMVEFHERLGRGRSKDVALRDAMRKLAKDPATAHPYYWAPFILVGDPRALPAGAR